MRAAWLWLVLAFVLAAPPAQAQEQTVHLRNGFFEPSSVSVGEHERIVFVNDDDRAHTVTSSWDDGKAISVVLLPGQSVPVTFSHAGDYPIRCMPHSTHDASGDHGMVVAVHVTGATSASHGWSPALLGGASMAAIVVSVVAWRARPWPRRSRPTRPTRARAPW